MARKPTMQAKGGGVYEYRGWLLARVWGQLGPKWTAEKWNDDLAELMKFDEVSRANVRAVIDHFEDTGELRVARHGYAEKGTPGTVREDYYGQAIKRDYKGWKIEKKIGFTGPRRGQHTWYEATKNGETHKHHKLKTLRWIIDDVEQDRAKTMPKKKTKRKRKATAAQLRALAKGRATAARNRKRKAPKRKRVARQNPAFSNYQKARSVARGSTRKNPVKKLAPLYAIKAGGRYFDGVRFSSKVGNAARFATLAHCKNVAQNIADATGKSCSIVNLRK